MITLGPDVQILAYQSAMVLAQNQSPGTPGYNDNPVGPEFGIRIDVNGAWDTPEYALANLRALEPVGLELCEEPVHGIAPMRAVRPTRSASSPAATQPTAPAPTTSAAAPLAMRRSSGFNGTASGAMPAEVAKLASRKAGTHVHMAYSSHM